MKPTVPPIESILVRAVELTAEAERRAYVAQACAGDTDLMQRVEELIENHFRAGDFLEAPAWQTPQLEDREPAPASAAQMNQTTEAEPERPLSAKQRRDGSRQPQV